MEGVHALPHEVSMMTPAQVVAISRAAGKHKDGVQINTTEDYTRWQRWFAEQNCEGVVLEAARAELKRERDGSP